VLLLNGCIQLGACPDWEGWEPWAPVDSVARAIAAEAFAPEGAAVGYIGTTPVRFAEVFDVIRARGWPLEPLPVEEFRYRVEEAEDNAAGFALADYGLDIGGNRSLGCAPMLSEFAPLHGDPAPDKLDSEYVGRMLDHLVDVGFIPPPH
jgi:hypothetical protein